MAPQSHGDSDPLPSHNVVGVFPDTRHAIESLEDAGIDSARISLLGREAEDVRREKETEPRDERVTEHMEKPNGGGSGSRGCRRRGHRFLRRPGRLRHPWGRPGDRRGRVGCDLGGDISGGAVGGVVAGVSGLGTSPEWELTFDPLKEGKVLVGGHSPERTDVAKGADVLGRQHPISLDWYDARGRRLPPRGQPSAGA